MRSHIDWITFTMPVSYNLILPDGTSTGDDYATAIEQAWFTMFDIETLGRAFGGDWIKQEKSRAPYSDAWKADSFGLTLYAGVSLNHCCVEISGQGCERLIQENLLERVLDCAKARITRIDIACDIETSIRPSDFVEKVGHKRMRSSGRQISASGETEYVGSKTSERFARVYRYNEPHPRAHLLRVEHVFHKKYAKVVSQAILSDGVDNVARAAGKAFGWVHHVWDATDHRVPDLSIVSTERNAGKTVFWLVSSVAPAFKRLCEDGTISDPEAFIKRHFL